MTRRPGESSQAYRGRVRRERADAVDALQLQVGEPIMYAGRFTRFSPLKHRRSDVDYGLIRRLTPAERRKMKQEEKQRLSVEEQWKKDQAEREVFDARPDVRAAWSIFYDIETRLHDIIDRLTVEEWQTAAKKIKGND